MGKTLKMQIIMESINDGRQDFPMSPSVCQEPALLNWSLFSHMFKNSTLIKIVMPLESQRILDNTQIYMNNVPHNKELSPPEA